MAYESDPTLLAEVRKYGKFDVSGCYNCGSCTLSCDLATDFASFPRRSTRHVITGLRELLHQGLEPWICHDCGDCSLVCPRQTQPRDAMVTLRRYLASVYDWTGIASLINRSRAWHIGMLSLVAILVLLLTLLYHLRVVNMPLSDFASSSLGLEHMFPTMTYFTIVVILFPLAILLTNAFRMYLMTVHRKEIIKTPLSQWITEMKTFLFHFFTYRKMAECPKDKGRWPKHLLLGIGCLGMLALLVFALKWFQTDKIYPLSHPQRWLGYLAAAFLLFGSGDILLGRLRKKMEAHKTSDFEDWVFPVLLFATALSGMVVHVFRYLGMEMATHYAYAIHLMISVPMLMVEMAFGKWTHMIYRPLALYFQSLKERTVYERSSEGIPGYVSG